MATTPTPRSPEQILGDMVDAFLSRQPVQKLRVGGPLLSIFEAAARSDARGAQDTFSLLNARALDNATGLALDREGQSDGLPRIKQKSATGSVTITDASFTKLATQLFQASPAPIAGSSSLDVVDASQFPISGSIYIGRGTPNYEGPLAYNSKTDNGTHWTLGLAATTTRFHNVGEGIVLARGGNRVIGAGQIVRTPQANISSAVEFRTLYSYTLPDGESTLLGVQVVAQKPGTIGNVGAGDVKEFASPPFTGATVTNPAPFSNGADNELDDDYRERIRDVRASRQLGTGLAITTYSKGVAALDENKQVSSASLVRRVGKPSTLYIDDGTGYEEKTTGTSIEVLVDSASGGEQDFELSQRPVARAFVVSTNSSPYQIVAGSNLTVRVGPTTYVHNFDAASFDSIGSASAFEVASSVNSNPSLDFIARTAESGTVVVLSAKDDDNDVIEVVPSEGVDANAALAFQLGANFTIQLYKNDRLLTKDGAVASYAGLSVSQWDAVSGSQTLTVSVDGTPAVTYTFTDQDFINAGTSFSMVGKNTAQAWADVINAKIPGLTAGEDAGRLVLTSNAGATTRAAIAISGGSLVAARFFAIGTVEGAPRDYSFDRNESRLSLEEPLLSGDRLTAGTANTRAFVESGDVAPTTIASTARTWFVVDGAAELVQTGVSGSTLLNCVVNSLHDWGYELGLFAAGAFANVRAGDFLILWDPALPATLQGVHRVSAATSDSLQVERRLGCVLRAGHKSVALHTTGSAVCKVLTIGGLTEGGQNLPVLSLGANHSATDSCEIFDPNTRLSFPVAPMSTARAYHTATVVGSGKVVVVGGVSDAGSPLASIEVFDPVAGTWTASGVSLATPVMHHAATLLADGRVLITGGDTGAGGTTSFQIYDPTADTLTAVGHMLTARARHKAVLMPNQDVLIVGGYDATRTALSSCEIWSHVSTITSSTGSMARARCGMGLALIGTSPTRIIVAGNAVSNPTGTKTYEIYTIGSATWGGELSLPNNMSLEEKGLVTLTNGHVVGLHGYDSLTPTTGRGFTYDGTTFTTLAADPVQTDTSTKWQSQYVELVDGVSFVKNLVCATGGFVNLSSSWGYQPTAQVEYFNETGNSWTVPEPAAGFAFTLTSAGLMVVRTGGVIQEVDIPAGSNYTASTLAGALNGDSSTPGLGSAPIGPGIVGASSAAYKNTRVRVSTNTLATYGDVALVAQDAVAAGFQFDTAGAESSLPGHAGSVESSSELGTPSFQDVRVLGVGKGVPETLHLGAAPVDVSAALVGLDSWWRGADGTVAYTPQALYERVGANSGSRTRLTGTKSYTALTRVSTRAGAERPWSPLDRAYLAAPFAIGPADDLTVMVDNDLSKRFAIKMSRSLATVGSTYSTTNFFRDGGAGGVSLAKTFGLDFDFDDFAVFMPARAVGFSADSTRSVLFRYYRQGSDGDGTRVRFGNPLAPSQPVTVAVTDTSGTTDVTVRISSGAARTFANIRSTTELFGALISTTNGVGTYVWVANLKVSSASRTSNVVTATVSFPSGVTDHGFRTGDKIWIQSTDVNFSSGLKTLTGNTASTFTYAETAANVGATANIGSASRDTFGEANFTGGGATVGDFFANPAGAGIFRITVVDGAGGYLKMTTGDQEDDTLAPTSGALLSQGPFKQAFAGSSQTATQLAAAVNALAVVANSKCPVTATILGSGTGAIDRSTVDFDSSYASWYVLADGVNWVASTTAPIDVSGDYQLAFKNQVTGSLATSADWQHEVVTIAPTTARNVVDWLTAPTVSGLFTACSVQASDNGRRVQLASLTTGSAGGVQVQGGLANFAGASIVGTQVDAAGATTSVFRTSDVGGFVGGSWVRVQNTARKPVVGALGAGLSLTSWSNSGLLQFGGSIYDDTTPRTQCKLRFERQGRFVAVSDIGVHADLTFGDATPGSLLRITPSTSPTGGVPQVSSANQGLFRVLRVDANGRDSSGTIWIENAGEVNETAECDLAVYSSSSVMPGDQLTLSSPAWGGDNQGTWTVTAVGETTAGSGDVFTHSDRFTVDASTRTPVSQSSVPGLTADQARLIRIIESQPAVFVLKIAAVFPDQTDGSYTDVRWDQQASYSSVDAASGSVVNLLDKLSFPTTLAVGADGYSYDVGLLGAVSRVIYGDPSDTATYPGVAAEGSRIAVSGPIVKRLRLSLLVRARSSGVRREDVANRIKSAVATAVNQSPMGEDIAVSAIVAAAEKVVGVVSVVPLSPTLTVGSDLIPIRAFEKPLIVDLQQDVQVTFVGD